MEEIKVFFSVKIDIKERIYGNFFSEVLISVFGENFRVYCE